MSIIQLNPAKQAEIVQAKIEEQVQERLDTFAKTKGYDSAFTCITYEGDGNATFAAEAAYMKQARSDTWVAANSIMNEVVAGTRSMPSDIAYIEADLPALAWPA